MAMLAATFVSNMSQSENAFQKKVVTRALKKMGLFNFFLTVFKERFQVSKVGEFFF